ncbi:MAG: hypothetical protein M1820_002673 [Bogoriella megaspora]|nr:MAG: hypothetical protein M1820_002673 [Bogoriella megaspora]
MTLVVRSIEHADVAQCVNIRVASLGSLVIGRPPPYPGYIEEQEASIHRDLKYKPHVYHLKVVDTENDKVVMAYAKWETYERGRPDLEKLRQPMEQSEKEVDQFGQLRDAAHNYFCSRNGEMGKDPHMLLALLVTASGHRKRGAGSLLVKWGIGKSAIAGLPCYLQASEQGRSLYERYGFHSIGTAEFELSDYGLQGIEIMTEMLRGPFKTVNSEVEG